MDSYLGKPVVLVHVGTNFTAGPFILKTAARAPGNLLWLQKCGSNAPRKGHLRIRRTGDVDCNGGNGPWATFRPVSYMAAADSTANATAPGATSEEPPPPSYAASVEATSFIGVGTGFALDVRLDPATGTTMLAATPPPVPPPAGASGSDVGHGTEPTLPAWLIKPADPIHVAAAAAAEGGGGGVSSELVWLTCAEGAALQFGPFLLKSCRKAHGVGGDPRMQPFHFGCSSSGDGNLRVAGTGNIATNGGRGKWAQFTLSPSVAKGGADEADEAESHDSGGAVAAAASGDKRPWATTSAVRIMNVGNADKRWCLGVVPSSTSVHPTVGDGGGKHRRLVGTASTADPGTLFRITPVAGATTSATAAAAAGASRVPPRSPLAEEWSSSLSSAPQFDESVVLTREQLQHFEDHGYLQVKRAVPDDLVHAALGAINVALCSQGGNVAVDGNDGSTQYCPGVGASDAILNLLRASSVWTIAQRLLGRGKVADVQRGQIALRPPNPNLVAAGGPDKDDGALPPSQWHIDGMGKQKHSPFSLLVGVTLSDVLQPNHGNFCVFPGSHRTLLPLLKEQVVKGSSLFSNESQSSDEKPAFHNGIQLCAEAGDACFVHQKTAHRGGPNASPFIRYQVYFRLRHKDHARNVENGSLLDDLWVEFEGISDD